MSLQTYKQLLAWQRSTELVQEIYKLTERLPQTEVFGLTSQLRRASVSIPSNIAEGYKRRSRAEYLQFLNIANASTAELETQLVLIEKLYPKIETDQAHKILIQVQKLLYRLIESLRVKAPKS